MNIQDALRELVIQLIDLLFAAAGAGFFIVPILTLLWIIRFLRWVVSVGRGTPDVEELSEQATNYRERIRNTPERIRSTFRRRY